MGDSGGQAWGRRRGLSYLSPDDPGKDSTGLSYIFPGDRAGRVRRMALVAILERSGDGGTGVRNVGKPSMSERFVRVRRAGLVLSAIVVLGLVAIPARPAGGPMDLPASSEPRVAIGKSLSGPGFITSQGTFEPFERVRPRDTIYTRDLYMAVPGFQADLTPNSKAVKLTLHGNLPEMSDSNVLESAVILHDTSHFDLDFTLL